MRTNSESIQAVTAPDDSRDFSKAVAISSSIYPDPDTHIEVVGYGRNGDAISRLFTTMTGDGTRITRPLKWIAAMARHPIRTARLFLWPFGWSRRTVILLVMQSLDTAMRLVARPKRFGRGVRLQTEQDPERPNPTYIPAAEQAARWFAERIDGTAQSGLTESAMNIPTTAHILGGAVIGATPAEGVIDSDNRAFGYREPAGHRRLRDPRQPGRQPVADDHRPGRARARRRAAGRGRRGQAAAAGGSGRRGRARAVAVGGSVRSARVGVARPAVVAVR